MQVEEIKRVYEKHKELIREKEKREKADLDWKDFRFADLKGANFAGVDLLKADFRWADLRGANLQGAGLCEADLSFADLRGANLRGANLCGANLYKTYFSDADLRQAFLYGANLHGANLDNADLAGANLDFADLPLWCGSLDAHFDDKQLTQIAYHLCKAGLNSKNASDTAKSALKQLANFANNFHRVDECGRIKINNDV